MSSAQHLVNPEILAMAFTALASDFNKQAFVPAGDPNMGGGGQQPPAGGGAPPAAAAPDPSAGGGGSPPVDPNQIATQVAGILQSQGGMGGGGGGMGGGMGGGVEPIKPKIDVNVTLLQVLKILAKIADALGVQIPASEMVATQSDLTNFGMQQQNGAPGGPAGGGQSAIAPISPIQPAAPGMGGGAGGGMGKISSAINNGTAFADGQMFEQLGARAAAVAAVRQRQLQSGSN